MNNGSSEIVRPADSKVMGETESVCKDRENKILDTHEPADLHKSGFHRKFGSCV